MSARIRIHEKSMTATLAGISYTDLRHILTLATNAAYERLNDEMDPENRAHYKAVLKQIRALEETANPQMDRIRDRNLKRPAAPKPTPAERRARIERDRREDALLDDKMVDRRRAPD